MDQTSKIRGLRLNGAKTPLQSISFSILVTALLSCVGFSHEARAWGARGHYLIGFEAAKLVETLVPADAASQNFAKFFSERSELVGHLSNVPDNTWRNKKGMPRVSWLNSPNHFFNPERFLGEPPSLRYPRSWQDYLDRIRNLSPNYMALKSFFNGQPTALPALSDQPIRFYKDIGNTPWRAQELFAFMVLAFRCAKAKEGMTWGEPVDLQENAFVLPADLIGENSEPPLPSYQCRKEIHPHSDFMAALISGGILSHFIGDEGQPLHPTADHDGWSTGNGGLHKYFETMVLSEMPESIGDAVFSLSQNVQFRKWVWSEIVTDVSVPGGVTKLLYKMAANSLDFKDDLVKIDDSVAIVTKSQALGYGDHPRYHSEKIANAVRKPPNDPSVVSGFWKLSVERLSVSSLILAHLYMRAWVVGGRPNLHSFGPIAFPAIRASAFLWPSFDLEAIQESKSSYRRSF